MKRLLCLLVLLALGFISFSQEFVDDFDDDYLFLDAEDIEVDESDASDYVSEQQNIKIGTSSHYIPLKFSGHLESDVGYYGTIDSQHSSVKMDNSVLFDLENYLYFMARVDETLAVRGSVRTAFPSSGFPNDLLSVHELYFDYLMFDRIYITAGKKETSWGYTRLFGSEDAYSLYSDTNYNMLTEDEKAELREQMEDQGAIYTNILSDSLDSVSGMIRIPYGTGCLTGVVLYTGSSSQPSVDDVSMAGSFEITFLHTAVNIFGRTYPRSSTVNNYTQVLLGTEAKKTIFDTDIYVQGIGRFTENYDDLSRIVFTAGFYRLWDKIDPNFGLNIEFQDSYNKDLGKNSCRIYLDAAFKRLGRKKDWKIGMKWQHIFQSETDDDQSGLFQIGFVKSDIFKHADWKTGVDFRYHQIDTKYDNWLYKVRFGTSIKINMDY